MGHSGKLLYPFSYFYHYKEEFVYVSISRNHDVCP